MTSRVRQPSSPSRRPSTEGVGHLPAQSAPARPVPAKTAALAADLRVSLLRSARRLRSEKSDRDITDAQYSVLAVLDREGPTTSRTLAERERVQPPSMTRTVAGLAELGLVLREDDPTDGRKVIVSLTDAGRRTVRETRRRRDAWLARRLADLDPGELSVLAAASVILRRIADT